MLARITQNPVINKELRRRMRGMRAFLLITIYLLLLSIPVGLVYLGFVASENSVTTSNELRQGVGKAIFWIVASGELFAAAAISPALTAGAISGERERQTYDLLRTTLLSARSLVLGKLFSAVLFIFILLLASIPVQSLAFLFGGVSVEEVIIAFLMLVVTTLFYSTLGMFFSSILRSTLLSTVLSYLASMMMVFGIPALVFFGATFASVIFSGFSSLDQPSDLALTLLVGIGWLLSITNPVATAVIAEAILATNQSIFYYNMNISSNLNLPIISPWIGYVILYVLLSSVLILLSIKFVQRKE